MSDYERGRRDQGASAQNSPFVSTGESSEYYRGRRAKARANAQFQENLSGFFTNVPAGQLGNLARIAVVAASCAAGFYTHWKLSFALIWAVLVATGCFVLLRLVIRYTPKMALVLGFFAVTAASVGTGLHYISIVPEWGQIVPISVVSGAVIAVSAASMKNAGF